MEITVNPLAKKMYLPWYYIRPENENFERALYLKVFYFSFGTSHTREGNFLCSQKLELPQGDGVCYLGRCVFPGKEQDLGEGEFNLHLYPLGGPPWDVMWGKPHYKGTQTGRSFPKLKHDGTEGLGLLSPFLKVM